MKEIIFYRSESGKSPVKEFLDGHAVIVVTHAFQKKTQKTPKQAIKTAEQRMKDYFLRRKPHE